MSKAAWSATGSSRLCARRGLRARLLGRALVAALGVASALGVTSAPGIITGCAEPARSASDEIRATHAVADAASTPKEKADAAEQLERAARAMGATEGTAREIQLDLTSRAARLYLDAGEPQRARALLQTTITGLGAQPQPSPLVAQVHLDLADAERALGNRGREERALLQSLTLHSQLFDQEIADP